MATNDDSEPINRQSADHAPAGRSLFQKHIAWRR